jgi:hypothetical protein
VLLVCRRPEVPTVHLPGKHLNYSLKFLHPLFGIGDCFFPFNAFINNYVELYVLPAYILFVMTSEYQSALSAAEKELSEVESSLAELERRKAQLRSTIAGLRSLMGEPADGEDMTLTEAIRTVLKSSTTPMNIPQIIVNLGLLGIFSASDKNATIATILNRMVRNGQAIPSEIGGGRVGYSWQFKLRDLDPRSPTRLAEKINEIREKRKK